MTIELIDGTVRAGLALATVLSIIIAFGLWQRGARTPVTVLLCLAGLSAGALAVEALVALTVRLAAPRTAEFNEFRWVLLAPWRHRGLWLGGAAVVAIAVLAWRASRGAGPVRRAAMVTLRTAAAGIALIVFLQPAVELRQVAREPNRVAILVDDSRSMGLREDARGPSRTQRVRSLLDASSGALDAWREHHQLDVYTFSDALASASLERVATAEPKGDATLMRKALEAVRARYDGRDLAGVVLLSDGAATGDFDADRGDGALRDFLRSLDTRVHTVWAARPGLKDIAVARVLADEFAFVRTVVRLEAVIRSTGYDTRKVTVSLSSDGAVVRQKEVELTPGGETTVVFEVTPPRVGRYLYEISVPVERGEAVESNNLRAFVIRVIRDKIRVLQVAGAPSWDVRALRAMLEENPNVDLISFFILRTQDTISLVPNDEMSLIPFPTRELFEQELPSFDLIVLQNFEFLPYGIGDYLENIRSYVEGGGGLAMLGGSMSFSSGGYHGTPVAAALPVELIDPWSQADLVDTQTYTPELTEAGKNHPVTALRYAVGDNVAAWKALPPLEGTNLVAGAKPDATVLAVNPRVKTPRGKPMPVIVAGDYGKGKSLAITTDSLWRYGFVASQRPGDDGRAYTKLWENAIRWLIQDPDLRNLHVDSDAVEYEPGARVRLAVRLLGRDYQPLAGGKVSLAWKRGADPASAVAVGTTQVATGDDGTGTYELAGLTPGAYRIEASAEVAGKTVTAGDIFLVRDASAELDLPAGDKESLARVSAGTGGRALGPIDSLPADLQFDEPRVVRVDRRADVELWSRPLLVLLALLVLGLEWLLRQRSGYL
ncbi:MAG TPA: glutamine amidotransferase [Kofleriaceae bacterium]|nr:glutamine amidotransferase [Kofleriaceae bacterium]